ncbi:MAG: hypothetical protein ACI8RZ_001270 [Myxococcota bacterium]|jgi:hypothetical protein
MEELKVRRMDFGFPERLDQIIVIGRPKESFLYLGVLYVPG